MKVMIATTKYGEVPCVRRTVFQFLDGRVFFLDTPVQYVVHHRIATQLL